MVSPLLNYNGCPNCFLMVFPWFSNIFPMNFLGFSRIFLCFGDVFPADFSWPGRPPTAARPGAALPRPGPPTPPRRQAPSWRRRMGVPPARWKVFVRENLIKMDDE